MAGADPPRLVEKIKSLSLKTMEAACAIVCLEEFRVHLQQQLLLSQAVFEDFEAIRNGSNGEYGDKRGIPVGSRFQFPMVLQISTAESRRILLSGFNDFIMVSPERKQVFDVFETHTGL